MATKTSVTKSRPTTKKGNIASETPEAAPITAEMQKAFDRGICLRLIIGGPSFRRRVDSKEITAGDTDTDMLHVSKETLECDEYEAIQRLHGEIKKYLNIRALPIKAKLMKGTYFIPLDLAADVFTKVDAFILQHDTELVPRFCTVYEQAKAAAKAKLKHLYDERDYPSGAALAKAFYIQQFPLSIAPDGKMAGINKQLFDEARKRLEQTYANAAQEMRLTLRTTLREMIAHLAERLAGGSTDGKAKVFRESAVTHINDFLAFFDPRNVTDDTELATLVGKCRKVMEGVSVEDLRKDDAYRANVAKQVDGIKVALETLVIAAPTRKVKLPTKKGVAA